MAKTYKKRQSAVKPAAASKPAKSAPSQSVEPPTAKEAAAYLDTLVKSGQAVPVTPGKPLPAGATHEIVKDADGHVTAVRRRFSVS